MTPELRNYLHRCASPLFAATAVASFVSRACGSALGRWLPGSRYWSVDGRITRLRQQLMGQSEPFGLQQPAAGPWVPHTLTLAVGSFELAQESGWATDFPDDETTISLHRWTWLLRGLTDDPIRLSRERGIDLMRSWIRHQGGQPATDAYTTGERIVNGCLFLLLTGDGGIPEDLAAAFRQMGRQVAAHLEYYPGELTGNHAFNNARALLFAGLLAKSPEAVELAEVICKERLAKLVTADGFMREGSSHYHLLFTRWVLEMLWLCERMQHGDLVGTLQPCARMLVQRCWFFLVRSDRSGDWAIPLIGDVSPDCSVAWLLGVPWSSLACAVFQPDELPEAPRQAGWSSLFGFSSGRRGVQRADGVASFPASGFSRVDHAPWTVFVRAEARDGSLRADHTHHDLGSFVLFYAGDPVLVDCGRLDYTWSAEGQYGKSSAAHNTVFADSLGAVADGPNWLSASYRSVRVSTEAAVRGETAEVLVRHDGFKRLQGRSVAHERRIELSRAAARIHDRWEGSGQRELRARFHFAPGIELQGSTGQGWAVGRLPMRLGSASLPGVVASGWYSPGYGCRVPITTVDFSGAVQLPATLTYALMAEV